MSAVEISTSGGKGRFVVDGHDISNAVRGATVDMYAGHSEMVTLDLAVQKTVIDGEVRVLLPEYTRDALIALGWTPPAADAPVEPVGRQGE